LLYRGGGYVKEAKKQLLGYGIDQKYILQEPDIRSYTGLQYFDVWSPQEKEIFIDCGAYDGDTVEQFVQWTNSQYDHIYAFEPSIRNYKKCKKNVEDKAIKNCNLIPKGTWSCNKKFTMMASEFDTGDYITQAFEPDCAEVESVPIDDVLQGDKATFIKMDVEGSELESLKGAKNTIVNYHPRLAIAVYHRNTDFIEIPSYILNLNGNYKFKLRHYASNNCETVLYAE